MNKMDYVAKYIENGWGLTPVVRSVEGNPNSGKKPFLPEWTTKPIRDMETAAEYWDNDKGYNIGIMTGDVSGLVVLDVDDPDAFEWILKKYPEFRDTYIVRRNNAEKGRCHYCFRIEGFAPNTYTKKSTGWGDLCSNGKQVVAPPSIHYTGGVYEVINDVEPLPFKKEYMADLLLPDRKKEKTVMKKEEKPVVDVEDIPFEDFDEPVTEGRRNTECFIWARQMRDDGYSIEEVEAAVPEFCRNCDPPYDETEALRTVTSVFKGTIQAKRKSSISQLNYVRENYETEDGETKTKLRGLSYDKATDRVLTLLQGKVAVVYGNIVVLPREQQEEPHVLKNHIDLFSYLGIEYAGVPDWPKGKGFMTREELFSALEKRLPRYDSIEFVPHSRLLKGIYYVPPELPAPDDSVINDLLNFFTPETLEDRSLILALFMTVVWGGAPGQRAPFAITGKGGRGSGKSTLAETAAKIIGQTPIQGSTKGKSEELVKRLLSSGSYQKRVVMFDNETPTGSRIGNGEFASLFTLEEISGHQLYIGEASRKNYLTWIMTMNIQRTSHGLIFTALSLPFRI